MLITAGVCLGLDNIALGFVIGCLLAWGWMIGRRKCEANRLPENRPAS